MRAKSIAFWRESQRRWRSSAVLSWCMIWLMVVLVWQTETKWIVALNSANAGFQIGLLIQAIQHYRWAGEEERSARAMPEELEMGTVCLDDVTRATRAEHQN